MPEHEVVDGADLRRRAALAAGALEAAGLAAGDRLVLQLRGSGDFLAVVIGALQSGIIPVPLDPGLTRFESQPLIDDADPALTLTENSDLAALLRHARAPSRDLAEHPRARPMHYTSGTTGRPKGVFSGLLDDDAAAALFADERDFWQINEDDTHIVASPLHHSAPLRFSVTTLLCGGRVVLTGPFRAEAWSDAVARHHPTSGFVVPAHLIRLLEAGMPATDSFRLLAHAGAPCPEPVKLRTLEAFPAKSVWEFYGSTEGQFTACRGEDWLSRRGTVGQPRPGRHLRVDRDGRLWCRPPEYARFSYWRDEARTAAAWQGDEFTVGDLGRIDGEGFVYLDGRREDLVISGGVNVYPAEVESALAELPGVREAAVFGVPDPRWGQRVCAAIVGEVTEEALATWARRRLAPAKRPKQYLLVDDLPRTSTGKIRRVELGATVGIEDTRRAQ